MPTEARQKTVWKIWIEYDGKPILGRGGAEILKALKKEESISKTAKNLGMSYRYVWNHLERMRRTMGEPVVITFRGGRTGGGGAHLTALGERMIREYDRIEEYVGELLADEEYWEAAGLKISARNRLKGIVKDVEKGDIIAKVKVEVKVPAVVTALISKEAVEELDIKAGDEVEAVVKATEVMIAKQKT